MSELREWSVEDIDITQKEYIYSTIINDDFMNAEIVRVCKEKEDARRMATNVKADVTELVFDEAVTTKFNKGRLKGGDSFTHAFTRLKNRIEKLVDKANWHINDMHENHAKRNHVDNWVRYYHKTQKVTQMWIAKYDSEKQHHVIEHDHWPATWAFTYYVYDHEAPAVNPTGLRFPQTPDKRIIDIEHGKLLLFRGHVFHDVPIQKYEGIRYCIAGLVHTDWRQADNYEFRHRLL